MSRLAPTWLRPVDDALRGRGGRLALTLLVAIVAGAFYGAVMGSYAGSGSPRPRMTLYSAIKVPILIGVTFVLGLPSWYVLHALLGLRNDVAEAFRAVASAQAAFMLTLAALAPVTLLWYAGSSDYGSAILFNAAMFAMASLGAQVALRRGYAPLVARRPRHRWTFRAWLTTYVFVGIQMGWVLRPFIGQEGLPVEFFRAEAWDNAYLYLLRIISRAAGWVL